MKKWKGIILAGGIGSRLLPITKSISKQLLPVFDKPMIYYPISVLMLAGIREILIITNPNDQYLFKNLLGDGSNIGVKFSYEIQNEPRGIAESFIIGEKFIGKKNVCLILGDNIFYGQGLKSKLNEAKKNNGATVFTYKVKNPNNYAVANYDQNVITSIKEKPNNPQSNEAVTGMYFYDNKVIEIAKKIKPSARGELEITSINNQYIKKKSLSHIPFGRGLAWLDTGTEENLLEASQFVRTIENRQGYKIACIEEIAFRNNWISSKQLRSLGKKINNNYGQYLIQISESN